MLLFANFSWIASIVRATAATAAGTITTTTITAITNTNTTVATTAANYLKVLLLFPLTTIPAIIFFAQRYYWDGLSFATGRPPTFASTPNPNPNSNPNPNPNPNSNSNPNPKPDPTQNNLNFYPTPTSVSSSTSRQHVPSAQRGCDTQRSSNTTRTFFPWVREEVHRKLKLTTSVRHHTTYLTAHSPSIHRPSADHQTQVTLVKTAPLDPDEKYVFGFHPHGIISIGAASCFATEGPRTLDLSKNESEISSSRRGFEALFPGLNRRLVTLPINFVTPFVREVLLSLGMLASSKESFENVLSQGSGSSVVVVVGGADEAVETTNGEIRLVLEKRKGFVREAIKSGARLVPVLAFGENDLYEVQHFAPDHLITQIQKFVKKTFTFSAPVFRGRSIFFKNLGMMPFRRPVFVTVGPALTVPHIPDFDKRNDDHIKALDSAHACYIKSLVQLYDDIKDHPLQPYASPKRERAAFHRAETKTEITDGGAEMKQGGLRLVS